MNTNVVYMYRDQNTKWQVKSFKDSFINQGVKVCLVLLFEEADGTLLHSLLEIICFIDPPLT